MASSNNTFCLLSTNKLTEIILVLFGLPVNVYGFFFYIRFQQNCFVRIWYKFSL